VAISWFTTGIDFAYGAITLIYRLEDCDMDQRFTTSHSAKNNLQMSNAHGERRSFASKAGPCRLIKVGFLCLRNGNFE